jgi:hypothetical protein
VAIDDFADSLSGLHAAKHIVLERVRDALRSAGLDDIDVKSIRFQMRVQQPTCPPGTVAVWGPRSVPGGVEYAWRCE